MKRYHLLFLLCFIGWMPTLKADEIVREFSTQSGLTLSMDANIGVGISVSGWNQEKVYVKITSGARTAEFDAQFIQGDKGLEIRLKQGDTRNNWKGENLTCEIRVPTRYNVSVDIMGGNIALSDLEGVFTGKTMGGSLQLANLRGELDLKTMGGNIEVAHSDLEGKVHTMGGNILFKEVTGGVDGKTMGGQVMYENSKSPARSGTTGSEVKISTMGGEIKVADAPAGASVKTYGGDITIDYAGDHVEATTYGGDIAIREVEGWVDAKTYGGDIEVRMVGDARNGDRHVELVSYGGDIELTVPDGLDMDIEVELAYTQSAHDRYRIESEVAVELSKTDDWDRSHGSKRKYLYARGRTGSGKNRIVIKTVNGNVILKTE